MGKTSKVVVCGHMASGKTALIEQLIYGSHVTGSPMFSTIEDIYVAYIDTDRGQKEKVRFYDTAGLDSKNPELPKQYSSFADKQHKCMVQTVVSGALRRMYRLEHPSAEVDTSAEGYVLVYDVTDQQSFVCMDKLKKEIDKIKDKKEALIISLGNKCDLKENKQVDFNTANKWAQKEKVRLWEVSVVNRLSLIEPFVWLTSKMTQPPNKPSFPLSMGMGKKTKATTATDS